MTRLPAGTTEAEARARAEGYDSGCHDMVTEFRLAVQAVRDGRQDLAWLQQRVEALAESAPKEQP